MLHFGMKPPFSFERLMEYCRGFVPDEELEMLRGCSISGDYDLDTEQPTLKKWMEFDAALRNELLRIRAARKHVDPLKYLRNDGYVEPYITHIAMNACRNPSILEAEQMLDYQRWRFLDELSIGYYFDLGFLIVYAHKLLILLRWGNIRAKDRIKALDEVLAES